MTKTFEIELSPKDIIQFDPARPRMIWSDFVPSRLITFVRSHLGWPSVSPLERWHLLVIFLKYSFDGLMAHIAEQGQAANTKPAPPTTPTSTPNYGVN